MSLDKQAFAVGVPSKKQIEQDSTKCLDCGVARMASLAAEEEEKSSFCTAHSQMLPHSTKNKTAMSY